jgi:hypothetical protein
MAYRIGRNTLENIGAARDAVAITPHASNEIQETRAIMVNVDGDVAVRFAQSSADVTLTLIAGQIYPFGVIAVRVTGTTATGITGLY